ncbi:glucose-1-phosphate cytidylyltransferase [Cytobacillus firmus]|uniref:glucose-1-phosphate cytidylyltransferase n=1 Tax=Cytobacillus firmus TaxID=1399 RepID=UPI0024944CFC|nr:glucose-1-phosphate cytidylyltransferase [Cytobacillus firmus]
MKVVILAGGFGTRISEETHLKPKPMVEIGEHPILWHIMKIYSHYGFNDFIICLGYKGNIIREYFSNYYLYHSDVSFDFNKNNEPIIHRSYSEPWKVTLVDTGLETLTGGRIKRVQEYIGNEPFMLTYGDGLANINISKLVEYHKSHKNIVTVTATQPKGRFGALSLDSNFRVKKFEEKVQGDGGWINGGFFVLEPDVFNYIDGDKTVFEKEPLENLAKMGELVAYKHTGFWQPMDTLRDKKYLDKLWNTVKAPWKLW